MAQKRLGRLAKSRIRRYTTKEQSLVVKLGLRFSVTADFVRDVWSDIQIFIRLDAPSPFSFDSLRVMTSHSHNMGAEPSRPTTQ